ncbi:Uu.00g057000.m01.CDS01 [Anthostomella pinea]|uniref:Uu.00g057000.m01.CDS01 n=1 Tax=Anthostomella pinea TaxID=933095 RepID=A0AAI8YM91_9PEZI|nr:Uu.00g057000.m01.CDS01 [Anthostomella pinea]
MAPKKSGRVQKIKKSGPAKKTKKVLTPEEKKKEHALSDRYHTLAKAVEREAQLYALSRMKEHQIAKYTQRFERAQEQFMEQRLADKDDLKAWVEKKKPKAKDLGAQALDSKPKELIDSEPNANGLYKLRKPAPNLALPRSNFIGPYSDQVYTSARSASGTGSGTVIGQAVASAGHTEHGTDENPLVKSGYKWKYVLHCPETPNDLATSDNVTNEAIKPPETFVDRGEANKRLEELTSYEELGGIDAVASKKATLAGLFKLLNVEVTTSSGERLLYWVGREFVDLLRDLEKKERRRKMWSPPRPALRHYIVTSETVTHVATEEPQPGLGLEGERPVAGCFTGEVQFEKNQPLATFTQRSLANSHASKLFLQCGTVDEEFHNTLDLWWWEHTVHPLHRAAAEAAARPGGLYEATLDTGGMRTRLGFDKLAVTVHEVDDVTGPLNV